MRLFHKTNIDFIGKRWLFFTVSAIMILAGIVSLATKGGPRLGVDFTGGSLIQVKFNQVTATAEVRKTLDDNGFTNSEIQSFLDANVFIIRIQKSVIPMIEVGNKIERAFKTKWGEGTFIVERTEMVGPRVGEALSEQALWAVIFSWIGIIIYVAFRFKSAAHGVAGVIALVHDVTITVGIFSILNKEIGLTIIAALLTLIGYSINDTIVVYDRIRENMRLLRSKTLGEIINTSINDTLSRTIITSSTVIFVLIALYVWGGEVIHDFSLALLSGVIVGTYSSIAVASPLVYEWETRKAKKRVAVK
ncbi:MAG: protein translocase subunit SecF [Elusimicrobia bacterium]|nr:protein translocase subunit SecF [Elusimicrobiota bacterium]